MMGMMSEVESTHQINIHDNESPKVSTLQKNNFDQVRNMYCFLFIF